MANCKATLSLNQFWLNIMQEEDVYQGLYSLLEVDEDLTTNTDYFREDTLELGFENEADRIVKEALKENPVKDLMSFRETAKKVAEAITSQDFFGKCELSIIAVGNGTTVVSFATGGHEG